jgi:hypothetical protein
MRRKRWRRAPETEVPLPLRRGFDVIFARYDSVGRQDCFMSPIVVGLIKLLEALFVVGMLGSLAVLAVSLIEDVEVILDRD